MPCQFLNILVNHLVSLSLLLICFDLFCFKGEDIWHIEYLLLYFCSPMSVDNSDVFKKKKKKIDILW